MKPTYQVIVGNIGCVHTTTNKRDALFCARQYVDYIKAGKAGRADAHVTVIDPDGEIVSEWEGR